MSKAFDVARYLIQLAQRECEPEYLTNMRLQKLLYYVQGWSLAINGDPMFPNVIEAWKHGPVIRDLYSRFADFGWQPIPPEDYAGETSLHPAERAFVESIWESYKVHSATRLREMTHSEPPWTIARGDCGPDDRCDAEITHESMVDYFQRLYGGQQIPGLELDKLAQARKDFSEGRGIPLEKVLAEVGDGISS